MKKLVFYFILVFIGFDCFCQRDIDIIPRPAEIRLQPGFFLFNSCTRLQSEKIFSPAAQLLVTKLSKAAGINLLEKGKCGGGSLVSIKLDTSIRSNEGYRLIILPGKISIAAKTPAGVFYAVQSILQLLPAGIEQDSLNKKLAWRVPCLTINDHPRFAYRGIMLDVARNFMPLEFLKKLIDLLAMQKMNRLHLHLTDSQGWRFESKKYPRLVLIGAFRKGNALNASYDYYARPNDTLYGGYYTQEQLKDLVSYAQRKYITIIPEIEMPAHSRSALAAYPELACLDSNGMPFAYPQHIQDEYCTKEETFRFLEDILSELMEVFPSEYIHIGGDEAGKANWAKCKYDQLRMKEEGLKNVDELQSYFIKRIEKFVNSRGRKIIGWDEILQGGLAPNATVMSWTGINGGIQAAREHHQVIMTPGDYCYFDHYQSSAPGEPSAFCCLVTLPKVYGYDPVPEELKEDEKKFITGAQGNLWTEYIPDPAKAEYMIFPRAIALAEVDWSQPVRKDYEEFTERLIHYLNRLDFHQVNYSRHLFEIKINTTLSQDRKVIAVLGGVSKSHSIYYTLDGTRPTENSNLYSKPVLIGQSASLSAAVIQNGIVVDQLSKSIRLHKAVGKTIFFQTLPDSKYNKGGNGACLNGCLGNNEQFADDEWLGWEGKVFDGTIDFGNATITDSLQTRFFQKPSSWIWIAKKVTVQISSDGIDFKTVAEKELPLPPQDGAIPFSISWPRSSARFLRIKAEPMGKIPAGFTGAGEDAWIFVDELIVN